MYSYIYWLWVQNIFYIINYITQCHMESVTVLKGWLTYPCSHFLATDTLDVTFSMIADFLKAILFTALLLWIQHQFLLAFYTSLLSGFKWHYSLDAVYSSKKVSQNTLVSYRGVCAHLHLRKTTQTESVFLPQYH